MRIAGRFRCSPRACTLSFELFQMRVVPAQAGADEHGSWKLLLSVIMGPVSRRLRRRAGTTRELPADLLTVHRLALLVLLLLLLRRRRRTLRRGLRLMHDRALRRRARALHGRARRRGTIDHRIRSEERRV